MGDAARACGPEYWRGVDRWAEEAELSISQALNGRDNALNLARLVMAALIVVGHSWPLGGFGPVPVLGGMPVSWWALAGFFVISGYLTIASASRLSLGEFLRRRAVRIFPGLWLCLVVVGLGLAPVAAWLTSTSYSPASGLLYVVGNASTLGVADGVGAGLAHVPLAGVWNGSLWTLSIEFGCYLVLGALARLGVLTTGAPRRLAAGLALVTLVTAGTVAAGLRVELGDALRLMSFYLAGALTWSVREHLRVRGAAVVASVVGALLLSLHPMTAGLVGLPLAYLLVCFGVRCPLRIGRDRDLSYGVYLYGWPVTQLAVVCGVTAWGPWGLLAAAAAPIVGLAWLSWTFVESPALRVARRSGWPAVRIPRGTRPPAEALGRVQETD